jgi:hypothetical protein
VLDFFARPSRPPTELRSRQFPMPHAQGRDQLHTISVAAIRRCGPLSAQAPTNCGNINPSTSPRQTLRSKCPSLGVSFLTWAAGSRSRPLFLRRRRLDLFPLPSYSCMWTTADEMRLIINGLDGAPARAQAVPRHASGADRERAKSLGSSSRTLSLTTGASRAGAPSEGASGVDG